MNIIIKINMAIEKNYLNVIPKQSVRVNSEFWAPPFLKFLQNTLLAEL